MQKIITQTRLIVGFSVTALALMACETYPTLPDRYAEAYDSCDQQAGICYTQCQSYSIEQGRLVCQDDCSTAADQCFADVSRWAERESAYRAQSSFTFYGMYGYWQPYHGYYYGPHGRRYTYAPWRQPGYSGYGYGGYGSGYSGYGHPNHPSNPNPPTTGGGDTGDSGGDTTRTGYVEPKRSDGKPDYGVGGKDRPKLPNSEIDLPRPGGRTNGGKPVTNGKPYVPPSDPRPSDQPYVPNTRPTPKPVTRTEPRPQPQPPKPQSPKPKGPKYPPPQRGNDATKSNNHPKQDK